MNRQNEQIIQIPRILDDRGNLSFIEAERHIPFKIERAYWIYDVPGGEDRGAHAHKECHQFIVAVSGAFEVELNDGTNTRKVSLNRPNYGLYVPPGIWSQEQGFSSGSVCLVFASHPYDENDYIRDFNSYKEFVNDHR